MTKRDMLQATATEKSSNEENAELTNVLQYLAPWLEKTDGEEPIGSWETSLASKMMVKLLELWLTPSGESRESRRDTRILSSARSCGYGVCAGGVYDDWH